MAKKGMFGWLGFGKNKQTDTEEKKEQLQDVELAEEQRAAAEQAENARCLRSP